MSTLNSDCLFCKIIAKQIPSQAVFENDEVIVIHDIAPKAKVHLLAIPKQHVVTINDIDDTNKSVMGELAVAVAQITQQLGINESGYKVIINNGHNGGQMVPHMHWHLLGGERLKGIT